MELVTHYQPDDLLHASLESLHTQSVSWSKELDFWSEELSFFIKLLQKVDFTGPFPSADVADIQRAVVALSADRLEKLKADVKAHERFLSDLFRRDLIDEATYREKHRKILNDIVSFFGEVRNFKKRLFSFVEEKSSALKH